MKNARAQCCNHPYLFPGSEPDFDGTTDESIVEVSGKMMVIDRLLARLLPRGHRVVVSCRARQRPAEPLRPPDLYGEEIAEDFPFSNP